MKRMFSVGWSMCVLTVSISRLFLWLVGHINEQVASWWTHRKHPATPTVCWPLSHSRLHTGTSQCLESGPLRCAMWRCAREWSSPSGYEKSRQPLLVAVDTRRHPVNAQRSLEINPVCMSILARHKNTDTDTELPAFIKHTHTHTHRPNPEALTLIPLISKISVCTEKKSTMWAF